ncbi:arsenate reductase ArsC [Streptomyces adustus]|uniref:arsenate reductase ArsC n=1 Tax=Streptomyces adustus TaxID=1609272 RepID=UPI0035D65EDD
MTRPARRVRPCWAWQSIGTPSLVEAIKEAGIDTSAQTPKILTTEAVQSSDAVITMGCGGACPVSPGKRYLGRPLGDRAGQGVEAVRPIPDAVEQRVHTLLSERHIPASA